MLVQPRKYWCHTKKLPQRPLRGSYGYRPASRATVQFPRATVQSLFFFWVFQLFRLFILLHIPVYLFFQIRNFFPIYWAHTHHASFEFLALLSSSSRFCLISRATVQFLALLCSFLALLSSSSRSCPVPRAIVHFLELLCSFLALLSAPTGQ